VGYWNLDIINLNTGLVSDPSDAEIKEFWSAVHRVDSTLEYDVLYSKANVSGQQSLLDFHGPLLPMKTLFL